MVERLSLPAVRLGILAVVVMAVVLSLAVPLRSWVRQADDNAKIAADIETREARVSQMQDRLEQWKDEQFVERQARARLHYVYPGETGYTVVDQGGAVATQIPPPTAADISSQSWYQRLWSSVEQNR
jgi:cell division protein FtsB